MAGVQGTPVAPAGATQLFQPTQANAAGQFDYTAMLNTPQGGKGVGGDTRYIPRNFNRSPPFVAPPVASTQPYTGDSGGPSDYAAPLAGGGDVGSTPAGYDNTSGGDVGSTGGGDGAGGK